MSETKRPAAILRKQVVETATFGDLVVCGLMASQRLELWDIAELPGESADDRLRRSARGFVCRLLALSVRGTDGDPMYSAGDWDIQLADHGTELKPVVDKAIDMNGFARAEQEDAAKNG